MVLLHAILDPKEEVIFPVPYWVSYPEMVKLAGGVPVPVVARSWRLRTTVEEIAENIGHLPKAIIINSPNNRRALCTRTNSLPAWSSCAKRTTST